MNLDEFNNKYVDYLQEKTDFDRNKLSKLISTPGSIFNSGRYLSQFVKNNLSVLGINNNSKIPASIREILEMSNKDDEEDVEYSEAINSKSSKETTFNKDFSKNVVNNKYDKSGKLINQESSVYSGTGAQRSKYILEFNAAGDVSSEIQIEYGASSDNSVDLAIGYTAQGEKGDCWLLSTLNSLSASEAGKKIIENAISKNGDGTYTIDFKGVNTKIKITQEELDAAKNSGQYAKGDDDVNLFELGFERIISKIQKGEITIPGNHPGLSVSQGDTSAPLSGGNLEDAIFLLTGNDVKSEFKSLGASTEEFDKILSSLKDNPGKFAAIIGFSGGTDGVTLKDINGNVVCSLNAGTDHAFSIKSVDDDGVTIVNPWDSSKEYKISLADARKFSSGIQYYSLDDSFKETDTFDTNKLNEQPTQSGNGTSPDTGTNTPNNNTPNSNTRDTKSPNSGSPSGGGAATPVGPSNKTPTEKGSTDGTDSTTIPTVTNLPSDNTEPTKDVSNMNASELNTYKTVQTNELSDNTKKLDAIMKGSDKSLAALKEAADAAYKDFQTKLKEQNGTLASDYDKAKNAVEVKQNQIDENGIFIAETETKLSVADTKVTNAQYKVITLESSVSALEKALATASGKEKEDIQQRLDAARAALEIAKKELKQAQSERDGIAPELEELNNTKDSLEKDFKPSQENIKNLEGEIEKLTTNSESPLAKSYAAYQKAQQDYETGKAEAIKATKEAIAANQAELNKIFIRENELENESIKEKFSAI